MVSASIGRMRAVKRAPREAPLVQSRALMARKEKGEGHEPPPLSYRPMEPSGRPDQKVVPPEKRKTCVWSYWLLVIALAKSKRSGPSGDVPDQRDTGGASGCWCWSAPTVIVLPCV